MNYFNENGKLKDFLILILFILAMSIIIFNFIGVSEGATNNNTINMSSTSKNINESVENVSNNNDNLVDNINSSKNVTIVINGIKGYNESSNVILELNFTRANGYVYAMCGGRSYYFYLDISLLYKNNNSPLSNQTVYLIIKNETSEFITNEDGIIRYLYSPSIYGIVNFGVSFNGSEIFDNGSIIELEPVSVYWDYYLNEPYNGPHLWLKNISYIEKTHEPTHDLFSSKDLSINKSRYSSNLSKVRDKLENNSQLVYVKMKETSVPLIPLIVFLIAILGIFGFKRNNN